MVPLSTLEINQKVRVQGSGIPEEKDPWKLELISRMHPDESQYGLAPIPSDVKVAY